METLLNAPVLLTVLAILVIVIALLIALMLISRNYIKVSPNQAAVISGRRRKLADGTIAYPLTNSRTRARSQRCFSMHFVNSSFGARPTTDSTTAPSLKSRTAGMPRI